MEQIILWMCPTPHHDYKPAGELSLIIAGETEITEFFFIAAES